MINFEDYPFINAILEVYCRVRNCDVWFDTGYMKMNLQHVGNMSAVTEDLIQKWKQAIAKQLKVTVYDVDFITEEEYLEATKNDKTTPMTISIPRDPNVPVVMSDPKPVNSINIAAGKGELRAQYDDCELIVSFVSQNGDKQGVLARFALTDENDVKTNDPNAVVNIRTSTYFASEHAFSIDVS